MPTPPLPPPSPQLGRALRASIRVQGKLKNVEMHRALGVQRQEELKGGGKSGSLKVSSLLLLFYFLCVFLCVVFFFLVSFIALIIIILLWSCRCKKPTMSNCATHHRCGVVLQA